MAATYVIVNQSPVTMTVPGGTFEPGYEVTFETAQHKIVGRVRIPMSQYTPVQVDTIVGAQAALLEAVQEL